MADYGRISKAIVKAIADALRYCNSNEAQYTPSQMPNAVRLLKKRLTQKTITRNGVYIPTSGYDGFDRVTVNVEGGSGSLEPIKVHIRGQSFIGSDSTVVWNNTSWPSYQQLWIDLLPYQGKQITIRNSGNRNMYGFTSVEPYDGLDLNSARIDSGGSLVFTYTGDSNRYLIYDFSTVFAGGLVEFEIQ